MQIFRSISPLLFAAALSSPAWAQDTTEVGSTDQVRGQAGEATEPNAPQTNPTPPPADSTAEPAPPAPKGTESEEQTPRAEAPAGERRVPAQTTAETELEAEAPPTLDNTALEEAASVPLETTEPQAADTEEVRGPFDLLEEMYSSEDFVAAQGQFLQYYFSYQAAPSPSAAECSDSAQSQLGVLSADCQISTADPLPTYGDPSTGTSNASR